MSDVFREVDEEVRRERASALWRRYGNALIAVAVVIVVGVGGWRLWDYRQTQAAQAVGDRYAQAIALADAGDAAGAQAIFAEVAAEGPGAYPLLARLAAAAAQAEAGDREGAAAAYRAVAGDAEGTIAHLARIRAAYLMLDEDDTDAIMAVLAGTTSPDAPFHLAAQEILGLEAWGRGDAEVAETHFLAIVSAPAPPAGLRSRAEIMLDLIAGSGGTAPDVAPLPAPARTPTLTTPTLTAPVVSPREGGTVSLDTLLGAPTDAAPEPPTTPDAETPQ